MEDSQTPIDFEDIQIEVPWGYVAGRWYGNRKERPILALHGWQDNLGTWDPLIPLLPRHIGILCIDLPGHGHSSKYPKGVTYHVIDYVQIVIRVVKEYKWQKVSLLGHSMGGIVCFIYATLYPHTVDMLVQIDIVKMPSRGNDMKLTRMALSAEKSVIENERLDHLHYQEPPSYTYQELEETWYNSPYNTVDEDKCKNILNRSIAPSKLYPGKYYFLRDGRLKYYQEFSDDYDLALEMAKRLLNKNYMIVRSVNSPFLTEDMADMVRDLMRNNHNFEFHEVEGRHHVHLNNPVGVAEVLVPFILKHRPVRLDSWSMGDDQTEKSLNSSKL